MQETPARRVQPLMINAVAHGRMPLVLPAELRQRCALVQLTSDKARTDAHRFYERLGFVKSHEGYKRAL